MLLNCGIGEDSGESLGQQEIKPVNPKGNQSWIFIERTAAEAESPILWWPDAKNWLIGKECRVRCWGRLKAGEGDNRGWDGQMASLTQWIWIWASSESWWWTGKPGMLQPMQLQRVGHDWVTELTELTDWIGACCFECTSSLFQSNLLVLINSTCHLSMSLSVYTSILLSV